MWFGEPVMAETVFEGFDAERLIDGFCARGVMNGPHRVYCADLIRSTN